MDNTKPYYAMFLLYLYTYDKSTVRVAGRAATGMYYNNYILLYQTHAMTVLGNVMS